MTFIKLGLVYTSDRHRFLPMKVVRQCRLAGNGHGWCEANTNPREYFHQSPKDEASPADGHLECKTAISINLTSMDVFHACQIDHNEVLLAPHQRANPPLKE